MLRRSLSALTLGLVGCLAAPPDRTADVDLTAPPEPLLAVDGLVAEWTFDEPALRRVPSRRGRCGAACDGVVFGLGEAAWLRAGKGSGWVATSDAYGEVALWLDGDDDFVEVPDGAGLIDGWSALTIEARVKLAPWAGGRENTILSTETFGPGERTGLTFGTDEDLNLCAHWHSAALESPLTDVHLEAHPLEVGVWTVVAVVFEAGGDACLFRDGEILLCVPAASPVVADNDVPLWIGGVPDGGVVPNEYLMSGAIDFVRIYDRALTAPELLAHAEAMSEVGPASEPVAECTSRDAGCRDGSAEGLAHLPGVAACAVEDAESKWGPALDAEACAPGWRVCTVADLVRATPNRAFDEADLAGAWVLSQNGCGDALEARWESGVAAYSADWQVCEYAPQTCVAGAGTGTGIRVTHLDNEAGCTNLLPACGRRWCRSAHAQDPVEGVLCCSLACP